MCVSVEDVHERWPYIGIREVFNDQSPTGMHSDSPPKLRLVAPILITFPDIAVVIGISLHK